MKLTLEVDTDNAAFFDNPRDELAGVFSQVALAVLDGPSGPTGATGSVRDTNGNTVGHWTVTL